jgi:hypothetical protein
VARVTIGKGFGLGKSLVAEELILGGLGPNIALSSFRPRVVVRAAVV